MKFIEKLDPLHTTLPIDWHPEYQRKLSEASVRSIQAAIKAGEEIAAVSLAEFPDGGGYAVVDGQHRIEAARRMKTYVAANVYRIDRAEAPELFLRLNIVRKVDSNHKVHVASGPVAEAIVAVATAKDGPLSGRINFDNAKREGKLEANQLVQVVCAYYNSVSGGSVEENLKKLGNVDLAEVFKLLDYVGRVVFGGKGALKIPPRGALVALGLLARWEGFKPGSDFLRVYRTRDWSNWRNGKHGAGSKEAAREIAGQLRSSYRGTR